MDQMADLLTIAEMAKRLGTPDSTVRYYRDRFEDCLPYVGRGRSRRYPPQTVEILKVIMEQAKSGVSMEDIRKAVAASAVDVVDPPPVSQEDGVNELPSGRENIEWRSGKGTQSPTKTVSQGSGDEAAASIGQALREKDGTTAERGLRPNDRVISEFEARGAKSESTARKASSDTADGKAHRETAAYKAASEPVRVVKPVVHVDTLPIREEMESLRQELVALRREQLEVLEKISVGLEAMQNGVYVGASVGQNGSDTDAHQQDDLHAPRGRHRRRGWWSQVIRGKKRS